MSSIPFDFHTHRLGAPDALISVSPRQFSPEPGRWYSVGIHPWDTATLIDADEAWLERAARHPQVLALGETGLDRLRGAPLEVQRAVFALHLSLAAAVGKPLVVHTVRTAQDVLEQRRVMGLDATVTLAIHGMRANQHVARQLLDAGCYLSYGERFNPAALLATPLDRLLIETDDGPATIHQVASTVASALATDVDTLIDVTRRNALSLLHMQQG